MNTSRLTRAPLALPVPTLLLTLALLAVAAPRLTAAVTASAAGVNSITLTWTAPGDDGVSGRAAQYDVRYSLSPITNATWASASQATGEPAPAAAGSAEIFTVTGLNSGTTYYFAVKTADEALNWSALSNVASGTTAVAGDASSPAAVTNLIVVAPTTTSLTLVWTAPGDDGAVGTASRYDIRYSTLPISNGVTWNMATQLVSEPSPSPAGAAETLTVAGLAEATTYYFALKTADEVPNWSTISNCPSGITAADAAPPAAVVDLRASSGDADSTIDVVWTATGDDGLLGTAAAYEVRYSRTAISESNWSAATLWPSVITPLASGLEQRVTLTGLQPGEVYYVALKAYDDAANVSPLSNVDTGVAKYGIASDVDPDETLPGGYVLDQNFPNPFNPTTSIRFSVPAAGRAELTVYNTAGQEVTRLVDGALAAGEHTVTWDGRDRTGYPVASGVYYYRLAAGDQQHTKKMVLLK
ncbi:MAG TPA: FlgD immunoglobulin-like domain containing protein [candidate division Zixibacteria bacterium]|nr:FlgD immunoglobulin-like domain containing protein [candidate division Zixibacteria bacterium]MDM7972591.1 FlgD immunoglobulin-like domain containing protein [candidate division Zixibacteria bacterium]HOD65683.1 FlgD immunoglobulin-like domain containing protein [candidate division Zixibacteria bacterium]HPM37697.1 FlgD immunoglobulin-like domain containing protein [candidate division Zixibacteria bacterium]